MRYKKIKISIILFLALCSLFLGASLNLKDKNEVLVNFLDVGQGDAILIQRGQVQVLIDGGPNGQLLLERLGRIIPFWDRTLDVIIITHPDSDHIGGFVDLFHAYEVKTVIEGSAKSSSRISEVLEEVIKEEGSVRVKAERGDEMKLSETTRLLIENLTNSSNYETNDASVIAKLSIKDFDFFLTGDISKKIERELANNNYNLESEVLKIAHHGSKSSTSEEFIKKINPQTAIISVGRNNRYGHPANEILNLLLQKDIQILRTDEFGTIQYVCNEDSGECHVVPA